MNIKQALQAVPRENFLPTDMQVDASFDAPLPIGYGQTNSQPTTVRMMLEWLDPKPGDKVLDIGSGSGWTTGLLAYLVGNKGYVYGVERVPELVVFGQNNLRRLNVKNAGIYQAGDRLGLPSKAPFDRILASAAARKFPEELMAQLKLGGKLIVPVRHDILEVVKTDTNEWQTTTHTGFAFVPLV